MKKKSLVKLLHDLEQELLRLGYTKGSMQFYQTQWKKLLQFAKNRGEIYYSEQLGLAFIEKYYLIIEKDFNRELSRSDVQKLRVIRMIGDFHLHHTILRRYNKHEKEILTNHNFIVIRNRFKLYCENKNYSTGTVDNHVKKSARFMDYLSSQNITNCKAITLPLIHAYIKTLAGYTYQTVAQNICSMRVFLRFLLEIGKVKTCFAEKMPSVQARKQTSIPSVWTASELKKLIGAIDRGSPQGKRDYAIILLACCLGIRCMDIKNLKMEHFHWAEKKLIFIQSKTKIPLILPLVSEVGWAVIDYLKYGRPKIESPYIFVRHMAPFVPFSEDDHLAQLIKKYMVIAHIHRLKKKRGMHSLRHTMASMLLEKDTPLPVISDILGHIDTNATAVYLKVGIKKLKECALSFEEENSHE
jgi:integrase/recombinase XerD